MKKFLFFLMLINNETEFYYIKNFPEIKGEKMVEFIEKDSSTNLIFIKEIYEKKNENYDIKTITVKFSCYEGIIPKSFNIVTEQYIVKKGITSYLTVENNNLYMKVYVKDNENKIRMYENLNPQQMSELTNKFKPSCDQI